ncbi:MAG: NAD-dependent deacylase [candidate division NC10 bacterium]|nr:NAD-dependent deacylase [candidate division NC10 bacterium]
MDSGTVVIGERLKRARSVVVLTGAGVSAESGIPTFRGPEGLWQQYKPEDLATPEAFRRDPILVWQWYDWRRQKIARASPNPAHHALVQMEQIVPEFTLVTQNIDGLHRLAGSRRLIELHGCIWRMRCQAEKSVREHREIPLRIIPPRCDCGSLLRPDVVWFGEALSVETQAQAFAVAESADVFLTVGTSALVQPAASLPIVARQRGAFVIEINPTPTAITPFVDSHLQGQAGVLLPKILSTLTKS